MPCVPHISDGASTVVYYQYAVALKRSGYEVQCILLTNENDDQKKIIDFKDSIGADGTFMVEHIGCNKPIIYNKLLGPKNINQNLAANVAHLVEGFASDILVCFDFLSAWVSSLCKIEKKIAWLGDLNFETYWYNGIYALERGAYRNALENFLYSHPWKRCYKAALAGFSKVIVCSASSVRRMKSLGIKSEYLPYPWPAEDFNFRAPDVLPTIAFFGTLGALGSLSSVRILVKELYPRLQKKYGKDKFRIKIFGRGSLPQFALEIIESNPEFELLGYVPDIKPLLAKCHALIAPIEAPVGNRTRIITALAYRLPVIAHSNTALGNPDLVSEVNCWLADTPDKMLQYFYKIVDDTKYASKIAEQGYRLYLEKFYPESASRAFLMRVAEVDGRAVSE